MSKNAQPRVTPFPFSNQSKVPLDQAIRQLTPPGMTPDQASTLGLLQQNGLNRNAPMIVGKSRSRG